jgi:hypothetical protein
MKKVNKVPKKSQRLDFRLTKSQKEELEKQADKLGLTMTEVIEHRIENTPMVDNRTKRVEFASIYALCKEINYIGKNINQITIAIRQIKADRKIEDGEYKMILRELEKYNEKRNEISELLGKNLF